MTLAITELIKKSLSGDSLSSDDIGRLFRVPLFSPESGLVQAAARQKSQKASQGLAEVHAQVGLNIAPCPRNCKFCAFAAMNKVFSGKSELSVEEAVARVKQFETDGANAIFIMSTADYPLAKFMEVSREIRRQINPDTVLVANVGDFNLEQGKQLKKIGFPGVYHAVRLGEGRDTKIAVKQRLETFRVTREAGLCLGTCLEPVGNEHSIEELVEKTIITREAKPVYSGAARRIPIPHTELEHHGMVSEARMAHVLAVVRLALGYDVPGHCTHEPSVPGAIAGANLFWAESGANPRDTQEETQGKRGMTVPECRRFLSEAEWKILEGPSKFYGAGPHT